MSKPHVPKEGRIQLRGVSKPARTVLMTGVVVMSYLVTSIPVFADSIDITDATLPTPIYQASAIWDGNYAFLFGGCKLTGKPCEDNGYLDTIVRFDPGTGEVRVMNATLPNPRLGTTAVWDGHNAYIFGGYDERGDYRKQILRYNTTTDTISGTGEPLIVRVAFASSFWDGSKAYVLGGQTLELGLSNFWFNGIQVYDPKNNSVEFADSVLPTGRYATSAIWTGSNALIFGGCSRSRCPLNDTLRYDPSSGTIVHTLGILPQAVMGAPAIWDEHNGFIFGGWNGTQGLDIIVRYRPTLDEVLVMSVALPTPDTTGIMNSSLPDEGYISSAVWTGSEAYVFGGCSSAECPTDDIVVYTLEPAPPSSLVATAGVLSGEIVLTWDAPPDNTYSVLTHYRIYRSTTAGGPYDLVDTIAADLTVYTDSGLTPGTTYYYVVTALNDSRDESEQSNEASETAPGESGQITKS